VYVDADEDEHVTVAVPLLVKLVDESDPQIKPEGMLSVSVTVPVNPLSSDIVSVDVAGDPTSVAEGCVADVVKSGGTPKVKVAVAVWVSWPLVAVKVTVYTP
jgi:hypothetical protein